MYLEVPKEVPVEREYWLFKKANWKALKEELAATNWNGVLFQGGTQETTEEAVDSVAENLTNYLLETARKHVPVKRSTVKKSTHPWMDDRCLELVREKRAAEGTPEYEAKVRECSTRILEEFQRHIHELRDEFTKLPWSSKKLWKLARK